MTIQDPNQPADEAGTSGILPPKVEERAKAEFGAATETAKRDLDAITERAAEDVRDLKHQAQDQIGAATDKAKTFAGEQKELAAGQLDGIAAAITKVADELDTGDQQTVARYARDLAGGLTQMSQTIAGRDVDDLMGMAQDFGRKQPVAFLGAAALAGFMASRFALASAHRRDSKPSGQGGDEQPSTYRSETASAYGSGAGPAQSNKEADNVRS